MLRRAFLLAILLSTSSMFAQAAPANAGKPDSPAAKLRALFADSDESHLKRNPLEALIRGDLRYADQFGDYISDAYFAAERRAALDDLAALARIDRGGLGPGVAATVVSNLY